MAYTRRTRSGAKFDITTALQNPQFKQLVLQNLGEDTTTPKVKANFLERLLAMPMALGSIPDALARAKQGQNPLGTYLGNIGKGLQQTATGEKVLDLKTTQDLLKENNILAGSDTGSKIARGVLGFVGDVALDPTTYLTFGTGKLAVEGAKVAGEGIAKKLGQEAVEKIGKNAAEQITEKLATEGAEGAAKFLATKGVLGANDLVRNAASQMAKDVTAKFAGREILKGSPTAARVLRGVVNPLAGTGDVLGTLGKKFAPEAMEGATTTFNRLFNAKGAAQQKGLGGLYQATKNFSNDIDATIRTELASNNALLQKVSQLPENLQANLGHYIEGTMDAPAEVTGILKELKPIFERQGIELADNGIIKAVNNVPYFPRKALGFTKEHLESKLGKEEAAFILRDPGVAKAMKQVGDAYVPFTAIDEFSKTSPRIGLQVKGLLDSEDYMGTFGKKRTYETLKAGQEAGVIYDKNAAHLIGENIINSTQAIKARQFADKLKDVTDDLGNKVFYSADELQGHIPANYVEMKVKGMEGMYAPKEAYSVLKDYSNNFLGDEGTGKLVKAYDWFLKKFKGSVTAFSPGFISYNIRNALGDMSNMLIGGFGIRNGTLSTGAMGEAFDMGKKAVQFEDLMKREGREAAVRKFGTEVADLYENTLKLGVIGPDATQLSDEFDRARSGFEQFTTAQTAKQKIGKIGEGIRSGMTTIPRKREELMRYANLWDHYKQSGNWVDAATKAKLSSLDYSNLTAFEKNVAKRVIPFYSFMRQNLELQLRTLGTNPGRIMMQQKFLNNLGKTISSDDMTQEDWDALPDWMKEGLHFATGKKGNLVNIVTGFGDPTSAVNQFIGGDMKGTLSNLMNAMSPAAKIPIEQVTGTSLYTKQAIDENTSGERYKKAPQWFKDLIGYREITGKNSKGETYTNYRVDPKKKYWLENLPYVAPWNTLGKRISDIGEDPTDMGMWGNLLSGSRTYKKDLAREKAGKERTENERMNKLLMDLGIVQPQSGVYLNPSLSDNSPETLALLAAMGYKPKRQSEATKAKTAKKKGEKELYLEELLSNY